MSTWQVVFWLAVLSGLASLASAMFGRTRKRLAIFLVLVSLAVALGSRVYEHSANEQMRKPRHLNPEQIRMVSESLAPFAGRRVARVFVRRTSTTSETYDLYQQVLAALRDANWSISRADLSTETATGIEVRYDTLCDGSREAADVIVSVLDRCHLRVRGPFAASGRDLEASIEIRVGDK